MAIQSETAGQKWLYRSALNRSRSALTHEARLNALRSAAQARHRITGAVTADDFNYQPVRAHGSPRYAMRPAAIPTNFLFAERRAA